MAAARRLLCQWAPAMRCPGELSVASQWARGYAAEAALAEPMDIPEHEKDGKVLHPGNQPPTCVVHRLWTVIVAFRRSSKLQCQLIDRLINCLHTCGPDLRMCGATPPACCTYCHSMLSACAICHLRILPTIQTGLCTYKSCAPERCCDLNHHPTPAVAQIC